MPLPITASPHLATPSRAYCIAPTSRSPRFSPSLAHVCPRRKNSNQNALGSKGSCLTGFSHFGFGGKICYNKLKGVETHTSTELVRYSTAVLTPLIEQLDGARVSWLPGYRVKILDGNCIE